MGFFSGLKDVFSGSAGGIIGAVGGMFGADKAADSQGDANATNLQSVREQMEFQREQNQKAMDFSHTEASRNREFQQYMAGTSYSRAMNDMKAAGLNPMLAVSQGGAATPSGATASGVTSSGAAAVVQPKFSPQSFSTAIQAAQAAVQAQQTQAQTANIRADTTNKLATTEQIQADTRLKRLSGDTEGYKPQLVTAQAQQASASSKSIQDKLLYEIDKLKADTHQSSASAQQISSQNLAIKALMDNPDTRPIAALLQLWLGRK